MRLRIQTAPPLPALKAWYAPPHDTTNSIIDLKHALFANVPLLDATAIDGSQVVLVLDGFDLLDESPLDVVRDGDLVLIRLLPSTQTNVSHKRKAGRAGEPRVVFSGTCTN